MNEDKWTDNGADEDMIIEAKMKEMTWDRYFPPIRFCTCLNLFIILLVLAAPLLILFCYSVSMPGRTQYPYHYEANQLIVFLIILIISLAGVFLVFMAKDKSRLETVKWLSLADAVMMCLAFCLFEREIGHASGYERILYWVIFIGACLGVVSCIRVFKAYKNL